MKKSLCFCLIALLMVFITLTSMSAIAKDITVFCNGKQVEFDVKPTLINQRTMVPFRAIFEKLGASVDWVEATETVIAKKDDIVIELSIGNTIMKKNSTEITLDSAPCLISDRTLVPVRAISEALGAKVSWDDATWKVTIETEPEKETPPATEVKPQKTTNKLILLGDSICVNYYPGQGYPFQGWGYYMQDFFNNSLTVINKGHGGYSTKSFIDNSWSSIAQTLNEGDYVMVSLGINDDSSLQHKHTDSDEYIQNLKTFALDTRAKGAEIIFITPTPGAWGNKISNSMEKRSALMKKAAQDENITLLDLNGYLYDRFQEIGDIEKVRYEYYVPDKYLRDKGMTDEQIAALSGESIKKYGYDYTHFNPEGAKKLAEYIIELMKETDFSLNAYLK